MWRNVELKVYKTVLLEKQNQILDHAFVFIDPILTLSQYPNS